MEYPYSPGHPISSSLISPQFPDDINRKAVLLTKDIGRSSAATLITHDYLPKKTLVSLRNPNVAKRYSYLTDGFKEWGQYEIEWPEYDPVNQTYLNLSKFAKTLDVYTPRNKKTLINTNYLVAKAPLKLILLLFARHEVIAILRNKMK